MDLNIKQQSSNIISEKDSLRLALLKFISCIAVIYIHSYTPQYEFFKLAVDPFPAVKFTELVFSQYIARLAVPVFFCVSGFIYFAKQYDTGLGKFAWKKSQSILLPYFIWNTLAIFGIFAAQLPETVRRIFPPEKIVANFGVADWFNAYIGYGKAWYPFLYPLWFLPYLFAVFIVVHAFRKYFCRYDWLIWWLAAVNIVWLSYVPFGKLSGLWSTMALSVYTLSFFTMGKLLVEYKSWLDNISVSVCSAVIYVIVITLESLHIMPEISWLALSLYAGVILAFSLAGRLVNCSGKNKKRILFLSGFAFLIYLTHEFALSALQAVVYRVLPRQSWLVLMTFVLLPILLTAGLIVAGYILKKLLPKVYAFLFSGR